MYNFMYEEQTNLKHGTQIVKNKKKFYSGAILWNHLLVNIRRIETYEAFTTRE